MQTDDEQIKQLITNPAEHFSNPAEVLNNAQLSNEDKRRILESWKVDEQELAKATEENMGDSDSNQLDKVVAALKSLAGES